MKENVSSLELHYIVKELQTIVGARIDKIYQPSKNELYIQLYSSKIKKAFLHISVPKVIYLAKNKPEMGDPSQFCLLLRKNIQMGYIDAIEQLGADRIVKLVVSRPEKKFEIFIELFAKGNIVLSIDDRITGVLIGQRMRDRTVRGGVKYDPPKANFDIKNTSLEDFEKLFEEEPNPEKVLAAKVGMGKIYAQEALVVAGVRKDDKINKVKIKALYGAVKSLYDRNINAVGLSGEVFPFEITNLETDTKYGSFSEGIAEVMDITAPVIKSPLEKKREKLMSIIKAQEATLKKNEDQISQATRAGDMIYENYQLISSLLDKIKKMKGQDWKDIKTEILKNDKVADFDLKNKKLTLIMA
ncbi:NFACT family protein [Candidatus Woesearchaeota archaeon]|nr:NFACT family protein [Candidatus Woesearchaeota archaeon]